VASDCNSGISEFRKFRAFSNTEIPEFLYEKFRNFGIKNIAFILLLFVYKTINNQQKCCSCAGLCMRSVKRNVTELKHNSSKQCWSWTGLLRLRDNLLTIENSPKWHNIRFFVFLKSTLPKEIEKTVCWEPTNIFVCPTCTSALCKCVVEFMLIAWFGCVFCLSTFWIY
jgi:hypothetical protein